MSEQAEIIEDTVLIKVENGIGTLTLNRPARLNCICLDMLEVIIRKLDLLLNDDEVKVVVLTGAGRAFCAGADQRTMVECDAQEWEFRVERYLDPVRMIANSEKPVIAALNGDTVGGGLGLAISCDYRIAVDTARYGAPFIAIGLAGCDMACGYFLPRMIGMGRATDMMMSARLVKGEEAQQIGLVNQIVPAEELDEAVLKQATTLASYSGKAMGWTKKAIRRSMDRDMNAEFDFEVMAQIQCLQTKEHRESLRHYQATMMGKGKSDK